MRSVLVSSTEPYSGKSALIMALAMTLRERGLRVGYMKPVGDLVVEAGGGLADDDAVTMKKVLGLEEGLDEIAPVLFTRQLLEDALEGKARKLAPALEQAFRQAGRDKDVVILEGAPSPGGGSVLGLSDPEVARITGSKVLLVARYRDEFSADRVSAYLELLPGDAEVLGLVFNKTGAESVSFVRDRLAPYFDRRGVRALGVIPLDRALQTIPAREIADGLNGQVLAGAGGLDVAVEDIVVGAMSPDSALMVFRRKRNRAVITGGDRADLQLAAMEARMPVIILTGNLYPAAPVLGRAEELGVPVILVPDDTITTVDRMEALLRGVRIKDPQKIGRMKRMFDQYVDADAIVKALTE